MAVVPAVPVPLGIAVVFPFSAALARCAGDGAVRTTVAVSLRGMACWFAFAASCGVTPSVAGADAVPAGAAVCAETLAITKASAAPKGIDLR